MSRPSPEVEKLKADEKAYLYIASGILYAFQHGAPHDAYEDILHSGFLLYRSILKMEFLNGMTGALCPNGKPPEVREIIHAFNQLISELEATGKAIEKYHDRFTILIETLSEKEPHHG